MFYYRTLSDDAVVGVINLAATAQEVDLSSLSKVPQKLVVAASGITCSLEKGYGITYSYSLVFYGNRAT